MWAGYENALLYYGALCCVEWIRRGNDDNTFDFFIQSYNKSRNSEYPPWLGDEVFHRSHRSNLIRKFPEYYRDVLHWSDPDDLPYYWPL